MLYYCNWFVCIFDRFIFYYQGAIAAFPIFVNLFYALDRRCDLLAFCFIIKNVAKTLCCICGVFIKCNELARSTVAVLTSFSKYQSVISVLVVNFENAFLHSTGGYSGK